MLSSFLLSISPLRGDFKLTNNKVKHDIYASFHKSKINNNIVKHICAERLYLILWTGLTFLGSN